MGDLEDLRSHVLSPLLPDQKEENHTLEEGM